MNRLSFHVNRILLTVFALVMMLDICFLSAAAQANTQEKQTLRRFVFVVGANDGGPGRVELRFAHDDAKAVAKVLRELGGVRSPDTFILIEPDQQKLRDALGRFRDQINLAKSMGRRVELVFYYSGHSDEKGLLLGKDLFTYSEVRNAIDTMPADVKIAVVDSCSSGALTRQKGGKRRAAFLVDHSANVKGHAFLTSASADESAQESDRVGGSFFTHYLVTGLRGAADASRDGRVTINEAYHYAFHETLARTESTTAGPQHPNYDFQLSGSGDLVLTDLSDTSALLILANDIHGRIFIRDEAGRLAAEINKPKGRSISLGLEPGKYQVTIERRPEWFKGEFELVHGKQTVLRKSQLVAMGPEKATPRGDSQPEEEVINDRPIAVSIFPGLNTNMGLPSPIRNKFSLNLILDWSDYLRGAEISTVGAIRKRDVTGGMASGAFNFVKGDLVGGQAAAGVNINLGHVKGFQGAAGGNYVGQDAVGFQGAAGANIAVKSFKGFQGSSGLNYTTNMVGAQLSYVNVAWESIRGFQGGMVNYAGNVRGVQLGLVNFSQSIDKGAPIGLVNYVANGMLVPTVWASDTSVMNVGIKMGSKNFYGIYGFGAQPFKDQSYGTATIGFGGHVDFSPWWMEVDFCAQKFIDDFEDEYYVDGVLKLRFLAGYRTGKSFSIYAGPTLNLMASEVRDNAGFDIAFAKKKIKEEDQWKDDQEDVEIGDVFTKFYPGFVLGMQFEPKIGKLNRH